MVSYDMEIITTYLDIAQLSGKYDNSERHPTIPSHIDNSHDVARLPCKFPSMPTGKVFLPLRSRPADPHRP